MWAVMADLMKTSELGVTEKVGGGSRRSRLYPRSLYENIVTSLGSAPASFTL